VSYGFCIQTTENRTGNDVVELSTKHRYLKDGEYLSFFFVNFF
jgi:hypothetical protein